MINHATRIDGLVKAHLKTVALGADTGYAVAQGFAPQLNEAGQVVGFVPAWLVTVTLRNTLLGQPDFVRLTPVPGMLPSDDMFRQAVATLFEILCQEQAEATRVPVGLKL